MLYAYVTVLPILFTPIVAQQPRLETYAQLNEGPVSNIPDLGTMG